MKNMTSLIAIFARWIQEEKAGRTPPPASRETKQLASDYWPLTIKKEKK